MDANVEAAIATVPSLHSNVTNVEVPVIHELNTNFLDTPKPPGDNEGPTSIASQTVTPVSIPATPISISKELASTLNSQSEKTKARVARPPQANRSDFTVVVSGPTYTST